LRTQQIRNRLLSTTIIGGIAALAFAAPVMAQDATEEAEVDDVVVTGSRIARTADFEAISPVVTVTSEQIELTGTLTVESLLNDLPQVVAGNNRSSNNSGGEDFSTVDLRGLGANRTLVLVNGERVPGSSTTGTVDINTIPASLIQRVEVVTGGASAVYGSDAIAGVINFVLKEDYEGAELSATYGSSFDGLAPEVEINGLFGGSFANGRGNLTAYAAYYQRDSVSQSEFDYSRTSGALCAPDSSFIGIYVCDTAAEAAAAIAGGGSVANPGGSGTPSWGWITRNAANPFNAALLNANPLTSGQFASYDHDCNPATPNIAYSTAGLSFNDAGALEPRNTAGACGVPDRAAGSSRYNFAPDNLLILPAERFNITTIGTYQITDTLKAKVQLNYVNSKTEVQLAPTPATGLSVTLTPATLALINANAPDLAFALSTRPNPLANFTIDRRMNEVGTRNAENENNSFYMLTTLEGQFSEAWDWSLTGSYGQSRFDTRALNSVNKTALQQGLAGCQTAAGAPLGVSALPGCVPLDIYGPNTLTPAMQSFIRVNTFSSTVVEESRITGFTRGNLFTLPAGPIAGVLGFEYRDSQAVSVVDNELRTGNIFGFNAIQDQGGAVQVAEIYGEASVPLLADLPFAHYLGLELGVRYSDYSSIGEVWTNKVGIDYAPTDFLRFRGVYNKATRAPNVFELFQNGDQGFPTYTDPCNNPGVPNASAATQAFCSGQSGGFGFAGFQQNNSQVEAFAFGNPNLQPETAETITAGLVFTPDFFPVGNLRASVDYYDIQIEDVIAAFGAQFFINSCYNGLVATNPDCARVVRNPVTGQIQSVNTARGNQGTFSTKGVDAQIDWSIDLSDYGLPGRLRINELASFVDSIDFNGTEFVGTTSATIGGASFDFKNALSATYNVSDFTFFARWTYLPALVDDPFGVDPDSEAPEASYIDASARWSLTDTFDVTAFVGNVLDEETPQTLSGTLAQANTDVQVYRPLGRTFSINARARF